MPPAYEEPISFEGENLLIPPGTQEVLKAIAAVTLTAKGRSGVLKIHLDRLMQLAATSSVALSSLPMCPLGSPPEPIQSGFDSNGNLRLECLHAKPQHCWDLSGNKCEC